MKTRIALAATILGLAAIASQGAAAACRECGTVVDVRTTQRQGEGTGMGAVIGGVAGGVLGHQVGSGRGKDVATVAGAVGGAVVGHQVEKNAKTRDVHQVVVRMEAGNERTFNFNSATNFRVGDRIKVVDKRLVRQ